MEIEKTHEGEIESYLRGDSLTNKIINRDNDNFYFFDNKIVLVEIDKDTQVAGLLFRSSKDYFSFFVNKIFHEIGEPQVYLDMNNKVSSIEESESMQWKYYESEKEFSLNKDYDFLGWRISQNRKLILTKRDKYMLIEIHTTYQDVPD